MFGVNLVTKTTLSMPALSECCSEIPGVLSTLEIDARTLSIICSSPESFQDIKFVSTDYTTNISVISGPQCKKVLDVLKKRPFRPYIRVPLTREAISQYSDRIAETLFNTMLTVNTSDRDQIERRLVVINRRIRNSRDPLLNELATVMYRIHNSMLNVGTNVLLYRLALGTLKYYIDNDDIIPDHIPEIGYSDDIIACNLFLQYCNRIDNEWFNILTGIEQ